jgi:hypothetical protein
MFKKVLVTLKCGRRPKRSTQDHGTPEIISESPKISSVQVITRKIELQESAQELSPQSSQRMEPVVVEEPRDNDQIQPLPTSTSRRRSSRPRVESSVPTTSVEKAQAELKMVIEQFNRNYATYIAKHKEYTNLDNRVEAALQAAEIEKDISRSGEVFAKQIEYVLQINQQKQEAALGKWQTQLTLFLSAIYPVSKIALGLASGAVRPFSLLAYIKVNVFSPVNCTANGVFLLLQVKIFNKVLIL